MKYWKTKMARACTFSDCEQTPASVLNVRQQRLEPPEFKNDYVKKNFYFRVGSLVSDWKDLIREDTPGIDPLLVHEAATDNVAKIMTWGPPERRNLDPLGFTLWVGTISSGYPVPDVDDKLFNRYTLMKDKIDYLWFGPDVVGIDFRTFCGRD